MKKLKKADDSIKHPKIFLGILSIIAYIGHPYGQDWYLWGITSFDGIYGRPFFYDFYGLVAMIIFFLIANEEKNSRGWFEFWFFSALIVQPFFQFEFLVPYDDGVIEKSIIYLIWGIVLFASLSKTNKLKH